MSEPTGSTPVELLRALAALAEPPTPKHRRLAEVVGLRGTPDASSYSDIFLFQLYPYASVHLGAEGMLGGETRDRIAGFWRAVGQVPPAEPDHLSALVGLYASLSERAGAGVDAEGVLVGESRAALLHEHIAPWVFSFLGRVGELATGVYAEWAELLSKTLRAELAAGGHRPTAVLPVHLRLAPPLPDPRQGGGDHFIAGLLAPARSGMIVTRADLARFANALRLGLRAGERRYALEHLLGQEPAPVLSALAEEARRQGGEHEARGEWLGDTAEFFVQRARLTADLLEELAAAARAPGRASVAVPP